tara:strand:+ start:766 stop:1335 length:570 start_codon:yes stop_codon:yes gene_type:complete
MQFGSVIRLDDGRRYTKVTGEDGGRVMVQLNNVTVIPSFDDVEILTLELPDETRVTSVDADNITAAVDNCEAWFDRDVPKKTLTAAYVSSLKDSNMNVSKATVNGKVVTRIYDSSRVAIESSDLGAMQKCDVILEYSGLWFAKKTFGPIWRLAQIRLKSKPKPVYPDEYLFQGDEVSEQDDEENDADFV